MRGCFSYGPYSYLEVMTWQDGGMDDHSIHGSLEDLERLGALTRATVEQLQPGGTAQIRDQFAANSKYSLVLSMHEDGFDAASLDANLVDGAG